MSGMYRNNESLGTLAAFRRLTDCLVTASDGAEVPAVMDVEALRKSLGPIYGISIGAAVRFIPASEGQSAKIVWIEQRD